MVDFRCINFGISTKLKLIWCRKRFVMKEIAVGTLVMIMTATNAFAWGDARCPYDKETASSCEAGYTWDDQIEECVPTPMS